MLALCEPSCWFSVHAHDTYDIALFFLWFLWLGLGRQRLRPEDIDAILWKIANSYESFLFMLGNVPGL